MDNPLSRIRHRKSATKSACAHKTCPSDDNQKGAPPRSCTNFLMVSITEVPMFLIVHYQKSGVTHFFAYRSTRFCSHLKEQVIYYQKQWYLGLNSDHKKFCTQAVRPVRCLIDSVDPGPLKEFVSSTSYEILLRILNTTWSFS